MTSFSIAQKSKYHFSSGLPIFHGYGFPLGVKELNKYVRLFWKKTFRFLSQALAFSVAGVVCGYAMWKELQFLAIGAFVALLLIMYKGIVKSYLEKVVFLFSHAKTAKYGDIEIDLKEGRLLSESGRIYSQYFSQSPPWIQAMIAQLFGHQIGLILRLYREDEIPMSEVKSKDANELQWRGLIKGDAPLMSESSHILLTELGKELARSLLELSSQPLENPV